MATVHAKKRVTFMVVVVAVVVVFPVKSFFTSIYICDRTWPTFVSPKHLYFFPRFVIPRLLTYCNDVRCFSVAAAEAVTLIIIKVASSSSRFFSRSFNAEWKHNRI